MVHDWSSNGLDQAWMEDNYQLFERLRDLGLLLFAFSNLKKEGYDGSVHCSEICVKGRR